MGWIIFFKRTLAFKIFHEKTKVITTRLSILPVTFNAHESLLAYSPMLRGAWRMDAGSGAFRTSPFLFNWTMMPFFIIILHQCPQYQKVQLVVFVKHGNNIKAADWLWHLWVISILQKFDCIVFELNLFIVIIKHKKSCGHRYHLLSDCGLHRGVFLRNNENLSQTCLCASLCSHIRFLTSVS